MSRTIRQILLTAWLLIANASIGAAAPSTLMKCLNATSETWRLEIDGEVIGEYGFRREDSPGKVVRAVLQASGDGSASSAAGLPAEVIHMIHVCVPTPDPFTGRPREKMVIQVVTQSGLESMLRSYLERLVERQEGFRQGTGRYAASTAELDFFNNRAPIPITIGVAGSGWSASAKLAQYPTTCSVAFGSSGFPLPTIHSGAISCATVTTMNARQ